MTLFDAAFLAAALTLFLPRERRLWLVAAVPLLDCAWRLSSFSPSRIPVGALFAAVVSPPHAACGLMLAAASPRGWTEALGVAALFVVVGVLLLGVDARLERAPVPLPLRGAPIRLLACATLYFAFLPVTLS
ncbi:MAG: hypothetical protein AB2A00_01340 [Myxococcota bacterium]